jgi:hypothetical protein
MTRLRFKLRLSLASLGHRLGRPDILDGAILLLTLVGAWLIALHQGGARAEGLLYGARCILAAACLHGAALASRQEQGLRLMRTGFLLLPFVGWLAVDAAFLAPDRGAALGAWVVAALGALAVWMTLHHARRTWSQAIALLLVVGPASLMASGAHDREGGQVRALLGLQPDPAYSQHFTSAFGSPGACAALMLLGLLPALAAALNPRHKVWLRAVAGYFALLLLLGLQQTHHGWAWVGFAAGAFLAGHALRRKGRGSLLDLRLLAPLGLAMAWLSGGFADLGVLRGADGMTKAPLAEGAWQSLLHHPILGGGAGSYPLAFESVRPHAWQTDPVGPGSLILQLVAEHGVLGLLLAALPVGALLAACAKAMLATPPATQPGDLPAQERLQLRRTLMSGGLAGVGAALWVLCFDHSGSQPGILLLVLLVLAVVVRAAGVSDELRLRWPGKGRPLLSLALLALPLLLSPLALAPLRASQLAQAAAETLAASSPSGMEGGKMLSPEQELRIRGAAADLAGSLRLNPFHAERAALRAQALCLLIRQAPDDARLRSLARAEADRAVRLAPRLAYPRLVRGSLLLSSLEPAEREAGIEDIEVARRLAPRNQATTLRRAQALGQIGAPSGKLRDALEEARLTSPNRPEIAQRLSLLPSAEPSPAPR